MPRLPRQPPAVNSQQQKMKDCNADAKTKALTGADRKTFMKTCLSGSSAAAEAPAADATPAAATSAKATQQQKMKDCNAQATAKTAQGCRSQDLHEHLPQGLMRSRSAAARRVRSRLPGASPYNPAASRPAAFPAAGFFTSRDGPQRRFWHSFCINSVHFRPTGRH